MTKYDKRGSSPDDTFIKLFDILSRSSPLGSMKYMKLHMFSVYVATINKDISLI